MDWVSIFDETFPRPGATDSVLAEFVADIARPLSSAEIHEVNAEQTNPYPRSDPLHATWRPLDASTWVIPDRPLPQSYLSMLRWSDGGEFRTGERWFQFFPTCDTRHGVRAMLLAYLLPEYMPAALPIAFNGGGTFYLLDLRRPAVGGEYPIVCAHSGYLGWESEACCVVADSFGAACRGTVNVDDLKRR